MVCCARHARATVEINQLLAARGTVGDDIHESAGKIASKGNNVGICCSFGECFSNASS